MQPSRASRRALRYIERHFATIRVVTEVADAVGCSYESLRKSFAREAGMPMQECLHRARVRRARVLSRRPGTKLYAIAKAVGYHDEDALRRQWKKIFGRPPRGLKSR